MELVNHLPNVISVNMVKYDKFNHFDFLWSKYVKKLVYDHII